MKVSRIKQNTLEKKICIGLGLLVASLGVLYMYFVSASVVHVVIRTEVGQEIQKINSEISLLESRFINAQHKVSADIASLQGYTKTSKKIFLDRSTPSLVLSEGSKRE